MTNTSIQAVLGSTDISAYLKKLEIYNELGSVGTFKLELDDQNDTSANIAEGAQATTLSINNQNVMCGIVDEVQPQVNSPEAIYSKTASVKGRNRAVELANLFILKKYLKTKIDDLFQDALATAGSSLTYTSPSEGPEIDQNFNDTYLLTGFGEAANQAKYAFNVDNNKAFNCWPLSNPPSTGVLLKSVANDTGNNILSIDSVSKSILDVRNYVKLTAGTLNDHWSENNALDWEPTNCTLDDDLSVHLPNDQASIRATITETGVSASLALSFPKYSQTELDYSIVSNLECFMWVIHDVSTVNGKMFGVQLTDTEGNIAQTWIIKGNPNKYPNQFQLCKLAFNMGVDVPWGQQPAAVDGKWYLVGGTGTFNWHIVKFEVLAAQAVTGSGGAIAEAGKHFWINGLELPLTPVYSVAEDTTSQAAYGKHQIVINRSDIHSQVQLDEVAETELSARKDPTEKLKVTCTFQPELLYAGYLVSVLAPSSGIGTVPEVGPLSVVQYLILSIRHVATPGISILRNFDSITELELLRFSSEAPVTDLVRYSLGASSPQTVANTRFEQRLNVLENSASGSGGSGGSSSGYTGGDFEPTGMIQIAETAPNMTGAEILDCLWKWLTGTLTQTASSGQNVIHVDSTTGLAEGDDFTIREGATYEVLIVDSLTSDTITATTNLVYSYTSAAEVYKFEPDELPTVTRLLRFKDNTTLTYADFQLLTRSDMNNDPILTWTQSLAVKKDFIAGGSLDTLQGVLYMGHGFSDPTEEPSIRFLHSADGYSRLNLLKMDGSLGDLRLEDLYVNGDLKDYAGSQKVLALNNMPNQGAAGKVLTANGVGVAPSWQDGIPGPQGETGPQGPQGIQGPQGEPGEPGGFTGNEILIGEGTIYWQAETTPHALEMDCSLIVDGYINAGSGLSVTGNLGVSGSVNIGTEGGSIYWQTGITPHLMESDCNWIIAGNLNVAGISVVNNVGVNGYVSAASLKLPYSGTYGTLTWNGSNLLLNGSVVGAQGPQGPQGPTGATGATGPQGPPGTTTWAGITDKPSSFTPAVGNFNNSGYTIWATNMYASNMQAISGIFGSLSSDTLSVTYPPWDAYDDLALVRQIRTRKNTKGDFEFVPESMQHLLSEETNIMDGTPLFSANKTLGWCVSVERRLLAKIDELEQKILSLTVD